MILLTFFNLNWIFIHFNSPLDILLSNGASQLFFVVYISIDAYVHIDIFKSLQVISKPVEKWHVNISTHLNKLWYALNYIQTVFQGIHTKSRKMLKMQL